MPDVTEQDQEDCRRTLDLHLKRLTDEDVQILTRVHNAYASRSNVGRAELRMARVLCERLLSGK